ncbi:homoserine O-acetyltransferase [Terricaulis sp.]|uniref:homoserine O-acetyltransferase MetX n=1 Tax=Terricaulis sp. TaxID=2768686 RepID=UPI003784FD27
MIHAGGAARVLAAGGVRSLAFEASKPLQLSSGESLAPLTVAFETYGALNSARSNAVLVCHALTGDQFVASTNPVTGRPAWWPRIVGPGRPLDTNRYFVIAPNVLGGCMGTTGPSSIAPDGRTYGLRFPQFTIADTVRAQAMLVEALGIDTLFLVAGIGMGGMQALNWASAYPKRVFACATVASAARQSAQNIAFAELGRQAIMADPEWRGGGYQSTKPAKGLAVARLAAGIANRSDASLRQCYAEARAFAFDAEARGTLAAPGDRFDANSYLYLTRAMDQFDLAADFGGNLANAFTGGATRHGVFAFTSDWRYPPSANQAIVRALIASGAEAAYVEIDTEQGHDAYLGDLAAFETALTGFVDSAASERGLALSGGGQ